jgi:RNA polymerase sporulation-specific sigma factor
MNFPKSELSKHEALQLWSTCHSEYAKEQIILLNYGIVFSVMQKLSIPVSDEDMFQTGIIGLLKAINTFDFSKGYQFSTYAFPVVRNEILLSFRKSKKSVKAAFSLDDNVDIGNGESVSYAEMIADRNDYEENTVNSMLAQQIFEKLSPREKRIFIMFFVYGKTQCEISERLEISRGTVSRIIKGMGKTKKKGRKKYEGN